MIFSNLSESPRVGQQRWSTMVNPGAGHPQMVQFLLDLSADATSFAGDGKTPLEVPKTLHWDGSLQTLEIFGTISKSAYLAEMA